jgi:drug/metabolite transporter (DMT)-like permease
MIGIWLLTTEPAHQRASRLWDIRPEDRRGGIALGLVSAIAYGIGNILRKLGIRLWAEPAVGAGVAIIFTMIPVLMTPTIWGQRSRLRRPWHGGHVLFVAWGVCTSVAQLAFFTAVKFSPVWMITVVMAVEPLLTMLLSFVFYRGQEQLGRWVLLSAALVVAGLAGLAVLTP